MADVAVAGLLRKAGSGLTEELIRALELWLCDTPPSTVDAAYEAHFADLVRQDAEAHPTKGLTKAGDAAWNILSSMNVPGAAGSRGGGDVGMQPPPPPPPSFSLLPHPPTFSLVRLATHVVAFSHVHVAGPRGLPPGAAGRPPGRAAVLPSAGGGTTGGSGGGKRLHPPPTPADRPPPVAHGRGPAILQPCPIHTPLECGLALRNVGRRKAIVSVRPLQSLLDGGFLTVEPPSLLLGRGEVGHVVVSLRLLHPGRQVVGLLVVEAEGGHRQVAVVRALTQATVFGVNLCDVAPSPTPSWVRTVGGGGYEGLPAPLVQLEARLTHDGCVGMDEEGIFRVAPAESEKDVIRRQLDAGTFDGRAVPHTCTGVAAATMIKVFLRELPTPIFSAIPKEQLLSATDDASTLAAIECITGRSKTILLWLRDLLVCVASHEGKNKMSLRALAICTGPNLFVTDESVNPMEALMVSQKAVAFLLRICQMAEAEREGEAQGNARVAPPPSLLALPPARAPVSARSLHGTPVSSHEEGEETDGGGTAVTGERADGGSSS